jgi:hypothetical protein
MSDLLVDYAELHGTAAELTHVADISDETAASTGASKHLAHAAGHHALISAGEDFFGKWKYGMDKLTDDARALVKMLESTVATFTDVDGQLASGVEQPR